MKVFHLLDSLNRGGAETLVLDICRNYDSSDISVGLITTGSGDILRDFEDTGIDIFRLKRKYPVDFSLIKKIRKLIISENIDVLHSHQAVDGLHAYLATRDSNTKTILSFHGYFKNFKNDCVLNYLIKRVSANITVSNSFIQRLKSESNLKVNNKFHVIYNGIDTNKLTCERANLKDELNIPNDGILFGMIGNFVNDGRDQLTVCKAFKSLCENIENVYFVFVGKKSPKYPQYYDIPYNYCKKNNLLDKIFFIGQRSDINNILNSLNGFIYASNSDSFGIAVVEAMMAGIPVIINDLPPLLEITSNGKYAKVFKSKDSNDLTTKMIELIEEIKSKKIETKLSQLWAKENFSIENHISSLIELYKKVNYS